jgi:AcrR family transcriptional regulator
MTSSASADAQQPGRRDLVGPSLTPREAQLLEATLEVLRETGYDKLTVDQIVARAHASKTTVYRRWPSKAELVCAAFAYRLRGRFGLPPNSGSLRSDLLALATMIAGAGEGHAQVVAGILAAGERSPRLRELLMNDLYRHRKEQVCGVLRRAVARGEIDPEVISDAVVDVLPAYVLFRILQHQQPIPPETLCALVDEVLLPSLTRLPGHGHSGHPATTTDRATGRC